MQSFKLVGINRITGRKAFKRLSDLTKMMVRFLKIGLATLLVFYFSLIISSTPVSSSQTEKIKQAIDLLEAKGFYQEVFWLRRVALYRNSDNWLNTLVKKEDAFASTNCPFGIVTIYPDFYAKAKDDTERAMVLLHEARHLQGGDEHDAYGYVWQNRRKLGWTLLSHGTSDTFITTEIQTREIAPELFSCSENLWNDCTENLRTRR